MPAITPVFPAVAHIFTTVPAVFRTIAHIFTPVSIVLDAVTPIHMSAGRRLSCCRTRRNRDCEQCHYQLLHHPSLPFVAALNKGRKAATMR